jgi:hypothetical protein
MFLNNESELLPFLELKYHRGFIFAEGFVRLSSLRTSLLPTGQPVNFVIDTGAVFSVLAPEDWETWKNIVTETPRVTAADVIPAVQELGFGDPDDANFRSWAWSQATQPSVAGITGDKESVILAVCDFYFWLTRPSVIVHLKDRIVKCLPTNSKPIQNGESKVKRRSVIGLSTLMGGGLCVDMRHPNIQDQPKLIASNAICLWPIAHQ